MDKRARGAIRRRLALGAALLSVSGLLGLAAPGSAQAAASYCDGRKVRTLPFSTGSVHVYKRHGHVCAVTLPKNPGTKRFMLVSVQARGSRAEVDQGNYSHRAGPVDVPAGGRCVWIKGKVGRGSVSSGWILC